MNAPENNNANDLVDAFRHVVVPPEVRGPKKVFQPWHKPRKHYVRSHQWCRAVSDLIENNELRLNGRPLSYLGLPGDDMLDIRSLHEVCKSFDVKLRYLGFNETLDKSAHDGQISNNELQSQGYPNIDGQFSLVMPDSLEAIGREESLAAETLDARAPYDVVNFDLCDSLARNPPGVSESTIQALRQILTVQRVRQADPWLLFLTTRATKNGLDPGVWQRLLAKIDSNEASSEDFRIRFRNLIGIPSGGLTAAFDLEKKEKKSIKEHEAGFRHTLVVGICKWLISLAVGGTPSWHVELIDAGAYNIYSGLDMFSLVFKLTRHVTEPVDDTGWTNDPIGRWGIATQHEQQEAELACRLIEALGRLENIDSLLAEDPDLWSRTVVEASQLMESARYSIGDYVEWVDNGCPPPPRGRKRRPSRRKRGSVSQ